MQNRKEYELMIQRTLQNEAKSVNPTIGLKSRIDQVLESKGEGAVTHMKHFSMKKMVIAIAIVGLLGSTACFAAGKVTSLISGNDGEKYTDFSKIDNLKEELGYDVKIKESYQNGFTFKDMRLAETSGMDDDGNTVASYNELWVNYERENETLNVIIGKPLPEEPRTAKQTGEYQGIEISYYNDTYKFVPEDYELTPEDIENEKKDDYYISYGSDEVKLNQMSYVNWTDKGIHYSIMGSDTSLSAEDMIQMAEEIIDVVQ